MRAAAEVQGAAVAAGFRTTAGEVAAELRPKAVAGESAPAAPDAAGGRVSGPERERFGLRESRVGEESSSDGASPGTGGGGGAQDALHQVRAADAGSTGRQAGPAPEPGDQAAVRREWRQLDRRCDLPMGGVPAAGYPPGMPNAPLYANFI